MSSRIVTGIVIATVGIGSAVLSADIAGFTMMVLCLLMAAYECLRMSPAKDNRTLVVATTVLCTLGPLGFTLFPEYSIVWFVLGSTVPMLILLFQPKQLPTAFAQASAAGFTFVYVGVLGSLAAYLARVPEYGTSALLSLIATSWASDTTAYFGGRFFGKSKLYEAVSPKKTWAGSWFGLVGAVGGVALVKLLFDTPLSWSAVVVMGLLGGVFEQLGDLCESMLKRSTGIKDSGGLLPGHGGLLDRIDGMLFAAPVVFIFYTYAWIWF